MKQCVKCNREFSDFVEICPQCENVLTVAKKRTRAGRDNSSSLYSNAALRSGESMFRIIFTGNRDDVEFVKSILDTHNIPSHIVSSGSDEVYDLKVSPLRADEAEELLEEIYPAPYRYSIKDSEYNAPGSYAASSWQLPFGQGRRSLDFSAAWFKAFNFLLMSVCLTAIVLGLYYVCEYFLTR